MGSLTISAKMIILTNPMVACPIVFQEVKTMRRAVIGQKSRNCQRAKKCIGSNTEF